MGLISSLFGSETGRLDQIVNAVVSKSATMKANQFLIESVINTISDVESNSVSDQDYYDSIQYSVGYSRCLSIQIVEFLTTFIVSKETMPYTKKEDLCAEFMAYIRKKFTSENIFNEGKGCFSNTNMDKKSAAKYWLIYYTLYFGILLDCIVNFNSNFTNSQVDRIHSNGINSVSYFITSSSDYTKKLMQEIF
jgi:hypothetical protein